MAELKGTRTEKNLMRSFMGECQAKMRYDFYSKQAKKDGYVQMSHIFTETANNEGEHAKRFYKFLNGDVQGAEVYMEGNFPVMLGDTKQNLLSSAEGEHEEHADLYPEFADIADEEGFEDIAYVFREIAEVEERHEIRFRKLLSNIEEGIVFKRDTVVEWKCDNCGYIHTGKEAPSVCPACDHPQEYYQLFIPEY